MRLTNLTCRKEKDLVRAAATVTFEDSDRPTQDIHIDTEAAFVNDLAASPHAFLVGCIIPALHFGERRLAVDHAVCPRLMEGLETVMAIMHHWTAGRFRPLRIEAPLATHARYANKPRHAAISLSAPNSPH